MSYGRASPSGNNEVPFANNEVPFANNKVLRAAALVGTVGRFARTHDDDRHIRVAQAGACDVFSHRRNEGSVNDRAFATSRPFRCARREPYFGTVF